MGRSYKKADKCNDEGAAHQTFVQWDKVWVRCTVQLVISDLEDFWPGGIKWKEIGWDCFIGTNMSRIATWHQCNAISHACARPFKSFYICCSVIHPFELWHFQYVSMCFFSRTKWVPCQMYLIFANNDEDGGGGPGVEDSWGLSGQHWKLQVRPD